MQYNRSPRSGFCVFCRNCRDSDIVINSEPFPETEIAMFCPNCSAEAKDSEQKFCKSCGTNIQIVADSLSRGQASLETYKFDFEAMKSNLSEIGKNIKSSIQ